MCEPFSVAMPVRHLQRPIVYGLLWELPTALAMFTTERHTTTCLILSELCAMGDCSLPKPVEKAKKARDRHWQKLRRPGASLNSREASTGSARTKISLFASTTTCSTCTHGVNHSVP